MNTTTFEAYGPSRDIKDEAQIPGDGYEELRTADKITPSTQSSSTQNLYTQNNSQGTLSLFFMNPTRLYTNINLQMNQGRGANDLPLC